MAAQTEWNGPPVVLPLELAILLECRLPREKRFVFALAIGVTLVVFSSMALCACGVVIGFLGGAVQALKGAN